jgi:hypothetical protein
MCAVGVVSPKEGGTDKADICITKIKIKSGDDSTFEKMDIKDAKLNDFEGKGGGDKWKTDDQDGDGDKQNCEWFDLNTKLNNNATNFEPAIGWSKMVDTNDADNDIVLKWTGNYTVYWTVKDKSGDIKGSFDGLYLDDPMSPIISGAKALAGAAATATAVIISTMI